MHPPVVEDDNVNFAGALLASPDAAEDGLNLSNRQAGVFHAAMNTNAETA